jgi:hypothetical protein
MSTNEMWYAQVEGFLLSTATSGRERRREAGLGLRVVLFRWLLRLGVMVGEGSDGVTKIE